MGKRISILLLAFFVFVCGNASAEKIIGDRIFVDNLEFTLQLVRKAPARGAVFMNVDDNLFEVFNLGSENPEVRSAFIRNVPEDVPIATFTVFQGRMEDVMNMLAQADAEAAEGCRWLYTDVKPMLAFNLRRASNKNMIKYELVDPETQDWKKVLGEFIVAEAAGQGEYALDVRIIYCMCFVKASVDSPVHRDMDWLDGMLSLEEYVTGTENKFEDIWRHQPWYAPERWQRAYLRTLKTNYYFDLCTQLEQRMEEARGK